MGNGVVSGVCGVDNCTSYIHYNVIYMSCKIWILCLSVAETLVIVSSGWSGAIFTRSSELINFVMIIIHCMGLAVFGY